MMVVRLGGGPVSGSGRWNVVGQAAEDAFYQRERVVGRRASGLVGSKTGGKSRVILANTAAGQAPELDRIATSLTYSC